MTPRAWKIVICGSVAVGSALTFDAWVSEGVPGAVRVILTYSLSFAVGYVLALLNRG